MNIIFHSVRLAEKIVSPFQEHTAPEVLNPQIVLWLFLNQIVSDFKTETAKASKLIPIHLDP